MSTQLVTTSWTRTYNRENVKYRPEGGWDGGPACKNNANPPSHPTNSFGGLNYDYCFDRVQNCTAVSQPTAPPELYKPDNLSDYTDGSKVSSPVCPYHPIYNPGTPAERMVHCDGDGYQSSPPGNWIDGATGAWGSSGKTTPVTWKYTARYRYCGAPPDPNNPWRYIQSLTVTLNHPLEEQITDQIMATGRTNSCGVDCYP
jgi:hypothetical protein